MPTKSDEYSNLIDEYWDLCLDEGPKTKAMKVRLEDLAHRCWTLGQSLKSADERAAEEAASIAATKKKSVLAAWVHAYWFTPEGRILMNWRNQPLWYRKEGWAEQLQALEERRDKAGQVYLEQLPGNQERAMIAAQSNVVAAVQTPPARNRLGTIVRRQPAQNGGASPAG